MTPKAFGRVAGIACLLVLLLTTACVCQSGAPQGVVYVSRVEHPPESWARIYHEVELCANQWGDYSSVEWFVSDAAWKGSHGGLTFGLWRQSDTEKGVKRRIIVVRGDTAVVRHEALHDILNLNGFTPKRAAADSNSTNPEHPMPPFGKCAIRYAP